MALVTNYSTLQTEIARILNRSDLTSDVPNFIQRAEAKLKRDPRCRRLVESSAFTVDSEPLNLPDGLVEIDSWYHDGSTYYGPIEIVSRDALAQIKATHGLTQAGVPAYAAVVQGRARFAPSPDGTYTTRISYWETLTDLSDTNTTNWVVSSQPDIYIYAALIESAPFLREDERIAVWKTELNGTRLLPERS